MTIETYTAKIAGFYMLLFLFTSLLGIVEICNRIRKNKVIWAGFFPCSFLYSIFGFFSILTAYMAYDDVADPNYWRYQDWTLQDFILQGIRTFLIWLSIGISLYLLSEWNTLKNKRRRKRTKKVMEKIIDKKFRGMIYIVQKGKVIHEWASGFADLPNEIPNTTETRFASASAGKAFVAVGILQLIEQGKITFEDTLGTLLDLEWNAIDKDVTVRQLLNHTSGVPDYFDENSMDDYEELWIDFPNYKIRKNGDLLPLFINKPMIYPKGEKFQYSNTGYVLLAMILEKVTGQPFDEYLKKNLFEVCGMASTGYYALDKLQAKCANHYIYCADTDDYRTNIFSVDAKGTGAGGAFVTVKDIVRFWTHLLEGRLIAKPLVSEMLRKQSGDGADAEEGYYGYGMWIIDNPSGKDFAYFQGCDPGVSFLSEYNPNNEMISVLASNYGDNVWKAMRNIRETLYK